MPDHGGQGALGGRRLRNIVRRDTGQGYRQDAGSRLAQLTSGIETPTAEDLASVWTASARAFAWPQPKGTHRTRQLGRGDFPARAVSSETTPIAWKIASLGDEAPRTWPTICPSTKRRNPDLPPARWWRRLSMHPELTEGERRTLPKTLGGGEEVANGEAVPWRRRLEDPADGCGRYGLPLTGETLVLEGSLRRRPLEQSRIS